MSNNVDITLAANAKEVERALDRMGSVINSQRQKLEQLSQTGKKGSRETASGFAAAGQSVRATATQVVGSLTGITSAAGAVMMMADALKKEWEDLKRRQNAQLDTTLDFATNIRAARSAFTEDATLREADFENRVIQASKKTGATPSNIAKTFQTVMSAKSSATAEEAAQAAEQAYRLNVSDEEQSTSLAAAALDVKKFSGVTDPRVNIGFVQNVQEAARITDIKSVSENLIPAIVKMKAFGDSLEQAGEIGTALTQLSTDPSGATSGTAMVAMGSALMNFVPGRDKSGRLTGKDRKGNEIIIPEDQFAKFAAATNTMERTAVLQNNRELREAFIGGNSFRKTHEELIFGLLRGGQTEMKTLAAAQQTIRGVATPEEQAFQANLFEQEVASKNTGAVQQALRSQEESKARIERSRLEKTTESPQASVRRIVGNTLDELELKDSNVRAFGEYLDNMNVRSGENPFDVAIKRLEVAKTSAGETNQFGIFSNVTRKGFSKRSSLSEKDVELIDETIANLKKERDAGKPQNPLFSSDPQMQTMLRVMERVAENTEGLKSSPVPRQTERPTSGLSRRSN